jgi:hypothetical protein
MKGIFDFNHQYAVFVPMAATSLLTYGVLFTLAGLRLSALTSKKVKAKYYTTYQAADGGEPEHIAVVAQNHENLTEMPPLFYVSALALFLLEKNGTAESHATTVQLAWGFFFARMAHTIVHTTSNNVNLRFVTFLSSIAIQVTMTLKMASLALQ